MRRFLGSFRFRVFVLVALIATAAAGTSAALTVWQATWQVNDSVSAEREAADTINAELLDYAARHGTWEGVPTTVLDLRRRTGQRIRLTDTWGQVIVDSDTLEGRTARPPSARPPTLLDPRPNLTLPQTEVNPIGVASAEIDQYRASIRLAACLTRFGLPVEYSTGPFGVARTAPGPTDKDDSRVPECLQLGHSTPQERTDDAQALTECQRRTGYFAPDVVKPSSPPAYVVPPKSSPTSPGVDVQRQEILSKATGCAYDAFRKRVEPVAPAPLLLSMGGQDGPNITITLLPVLAAATLAAVLAIGCTVLLGRGLLRPIDALIIAARRVGGGDLRRRVPVRGHDELAELGHAFNRMAGSLQDAEERQRRMIADSAHELRTPLANIRGYLEALKDGVLQPDPELFASLHEEAVLQQRIVDDLQLLALAEAGSLVYHRDRLDLVELVETCRTAHRAVAESRRVALVVESAPEHDRPLVVHGDSDRLRQVIGNLVSNALRATAPGGTVTLQTAVADGEAVVAVADTGHGIAADDLPYVFDRFWRADAARGRGTGGSGLGLAIAREIVAAHDGRISVASTVGAGTTFIIRLPRTA